MTELNPSIMESLGRLEVLRKDAADAAVRAERSKNIVHKATEALRERVEAGEESGDRITNLAIRFLSDVGPEIIEKCRAFEARLRGKKGELVALEYPSKAERSGWRSDEETRHEHVTAVRFSILRSESLYVDPNEKYFPLTLDCPRAVVMHKPLAFRRPVPANSPLFGHTFGYLDLPPSCRLAECIRAEPDIKYPETLYIGNDEVTAYLNENDVADPKSLMDEILEMLGQLVLRPAPTE